MHNIKRPSTVCTFRYLKTSSTSSSSVFFMAKTTRSEEAYLQWGRSTTVQDKYCGVEYTRKLDLSNAHKRGYGYIINIYVHVRVYSICTYIFAALAGLSVPRGIRHIRVHNTLNQICCPICSQHTYRGVTCLYSFSSLSLFYSLRAFPFHLSAHPSAHCI